MSTVGIRSITPFLKHVSDKTTWTFVRVVSADGIEGWGEATINGKAAQVGAALLLQHARLAGTLASTITGIAPLSHDKIGWAAASAIDQALWDILAQRAGRPLGHMLAVDCSPDVRLYANINRGTRDRSPAGFAATVRAALDAGFGAIKMAPFDDLTPATAATPQGRALIRAGLDRIAAAHDAIAGAARLMVDCHWRFNAPTAAEALREAARIGVAWFECPLPETADNIADVRNLRAIANAAGVQLAGMEECSTVAGFLPWADAYDVMMPDVKYAGGLTELFRIADLLRARGVGVSLHNPTGSVCHAVSLHVTAAMAPGLPLEVQWAETDLLFDLPPHALPRPQAGRSVVPSGIGHGARLRPSDLEDSMA